MSKIYLIPTVLSDDEAVQECMPAYIKNTVQQCSVFFVENAKTTRRYFKSIWKEMVIDDYQWHVIGKAEKDVLAAFTAEIKQGKNIGIVSEAGCPAIADPGQLLVAKAQEMNITVVPLVGPSSILLSIMASGFNGQHFSFNGYLPIENLEKIKALKALEQKVVQENYTQLFIETPYRNNQMLQSIVQHCQPSTKLCVAKNITSSQEQIITKTIDEWRKTEIDLHKQPVIFLLGK